MSIAIENKTRYLKLFKDRLVKFLVLVAPMMAIVFIWMNRLYYAS